MRFEILMADDNPGDVRLARESLRGARIDCNLHAVGDGAEALAYLRRQGAFADAPRPDGTQLFAQKVLPHL